METVHRFLDHRENNQKLPPICCAQIDNCFRKCKTFFTFAHYESPVPLYFSEKHVVSSLLAGHPIIDIDQAFNTIWNILRVNDANALQGSPEALCKPYKNIIVPNLFYNISN